MEMFFLFKDSVIFPLQNMFPKECWKSLGVTVSQLLLVSRVTLEMMRLMRFVAMKVSGWWNMGIAATQQSIAKGFSSSAIISKLRIFVSCKYYQCITDGQTDRRTNDRTKGRTHPLIEIRRIAYGKRKYDVHHSNTEPILAEIKSNQQRANPVDENIFWCKMPNCEVRIKKPLKMKIGYKR